MHSSELECHAVGKDKPIAPKFDNKASLPGKNGKPDQEVYSKFKKDGLRRRIWDSIVAGRCARCDGDHLRIACPKPRARWEDDFEKDAFFLPKAGDGKGGGKKQVRVQMVHGLNLPDSRVLFLESPQGRCLVDTCSDITLARLDVMVNVRVVEPETVNHLGGETRLRRAGDFTLGGSNPNSTVDLIRIFGVEHHELPA